METLQAIKTRRAVRDWNKKKISKTTLTRILESARFTPSPLNSQPWNLIVVKKRKNINEFSKHANHGSFITKANVVIVVTANKKAKVDTWLNEHDQHIYSAACAIQNMWLTAWALGLGACWVTLDEKSTRQLLGIPSSYSLIGSLAIGYSAEKPKKHKPKDRKTFHEIVSYEKFDTK